jgi:hypothetical protein
VVVQLLSYGPQGGFGGGGGGYTYFAFNYTGGAINYIFGNKGIGGSSNNPNEADGLTTTLYYGSNKWAANGGTGGYVAIRN